MRNFKTRPLTLTTSRGVKTLDTITQGLRASCHCLHGPTRNYKNPIEEGNQGRIPRGKNREESMELGLNPTSKNNKEYKMVSGGVSGAGDRWAGVGSERSQW